MDTASNPRLNTEAAIESYGSNAERAYLERMRESAFNSRARTYSQSTIDAAIQRLAQSRYLLSQYRQTGTVGDMDPPPSAGALNDEAVLEWLRGTDEGERKLKEVYDSQSSAAQLGGQDVVPLVTINRRGKHRPRGSLSRRSHAHQTAVEGASTESAEPFAATDVSSAALSVLTEPLDEEARGAWANYLWSEGKAPTEPAALPWHTDCVNTKIVTMFNCLTTHDSADVKEARLEEICAKAEMSNEIRQLWREKFDLTPSLASQARSVPH